MKGYQVYEKRFPLEMEEKRELNSFVGMIEVFEIIKRLKNVDGLFGKPGDDLIEIDTECNEKYLFIMVYIKKEYVDKEKLNLVLNDFYKSKMIRMKESNKKKTNILHDEEFIGFGK